MALFAQSKPVLGFNRLVVMSAVKKSHFAKIIERDCDLHPNRLALPMRLLDLGMGHFHEIGALEHCGEGVDEIGIRGGKAGAVETGVWIDLGIEVKVVLAQTFELLEILVMINGRQHPADLAEFAALGPAAQRSMLDQCVEQVGLTYGNELVTVGCQAA